MVLSINTPLPKDAVAARRDILCIQYLRAIAAFVVILHHIGKIFGFDFKFGASGVDMFFVISGFIMWMVTRQREASAKTFILRRLMRIVPLYWIATLILAASAALKPNLFPLDHPTASHTILSLLFIPHWSDGSEWGPLISQGWTLEYEVFFYALFALSMCRQEFRKYQIYILSSAIFICVACGLLFPSNSLILQTYTSRMLLEFLTGIFICRAWIDGKALGKKTACAAVVAGIAAITAYDLFHPLIASRVIYWGISAGLIVWGAVSLEQHGCMPKWRWLRFLGDASYAIYLTHFLTWVAISIIVARLGGANATNTFCITVAVAMLVGSLTHIYIEKPITKALHRLTAARRPAHY